MKRIFPREFLEEEGLHIVLEEHLLAQEEQAGILKMNEMVKIVDVS